MIQKKQKPIKGEAVGMVGCSAAVPPASHAAAPPAPPSAFPEELRLLKARIVMLEKRAHSAEEQVVTVAAAGEAALAAKEAALAAKEAALAAKEAALVAKEAALAAKEDTIACLPLEVSGKRATRSSPAISSEAKFIRLGAVASPGSAEPAVSAPSRAAGLPAHKPPKPLAGTHYEKEVISPPSPCSHRAALLLFTLTSVFAQLKGPSNENGISWVYSGYMIKIGARLKAHGEGDCRFSNRDRYLGSYIHDMQHGQGRFAYANGEVYEGNFTNGCKHGRGRYTWPNGDWYEGEFKDDEINGRGTKSTKGVQKSGKWLDAVFLDS